MKPLLLVLISLACCGCNGDRAHRDAVGALAANQYAAAQAASEGADLAKTTAAIRMLAIKAAALVDYKINGADAWLASMNKEASK